MRRQEPISRAGQHLLALTVAMLMVLLLSGCGIGSSIPNPFGGSEPTPVAATPGRPAAPPTASSSSAPVGPVTAQPTPSFEPFWVKNHRLTDMWSGPADAPGVVSFGTTSRQFCSFQVVLPPNGPRLYVFNPSSQNYFWIDADAIGPVGQPDRASGPPPTGQNCTDAIYSG